MQGQSDAGKRCGYRYFDMKRVKDKATYEDGQIPPEGFEWVLIGGEVALHHDKIVNDRLGRSVRR